MTTITRAIAKFGDTLQRGQDIRQDILLLHSKSKCRDCRHALFLHFDGKCSMCGCVRRRLARIWSEKRRQKVFEALAEGAKFYPNGIELSQLIYIASRHDREVFEYFQIARFGRRVTHIITKIPYPWLVNTRYLTFRKHLLAGKVRELRIISLVPQLIITYSGEGLL